MQCCFPINKGNMSINKTKFDWKRGIWSSLGLLPTDSKTLSKMAMMGVKIPVSIWTVNPLSSHKKFNALCICTLKNFAATLWGPRCWFYTTLNYPFHSYTPLFSSGIPNQFSASVNVDNYYRTHLVYELLICYRPEQT